MPRYSFDSTDGAAKAGALVQNQMLNQAQDDARYADQQARMDRRDARIDRSQSLDDEVKRWQFEKAKTLDENAKRMQIETDKAAIEANKELFGIDTASDDAPLKLAEWGAKYFRVLDEKTGDPRLIRQFQINQTRAENRQILKAKADEYRTIQDEKNAAIAAAKAEKLAKLEQAKAEGLVRDSMTIDGERYARPALAKPAKPEEPDSFDTINKDLKAVRENFGIKVESDPAKQKSLPDGLQQEFEARRSKLAQPATSGATPANTITITPQEAAAGIASPAGETQIIERNGLKYEVNHRTKAVRPL